MRLGIIILSIILCHATLAQSTITIAQGSFKVAGLSEETLSFGFAQGDEISFSLTEEKGKDIREIEIIEYPSSSRYSQFKSSKVHQTLEVARTGIYQFRVNNGSISGRVCKYSITRKPSSPDTQNFNTSVYWETHYDTTWVDEIETYLSRDEYVPKVIVPSSDFYINSGSNAMLLGGTSRITIPLNMPPNTVKWFYEFSASREKSDVENVKSSFGLMGQLVSSIEPSMAIANIGMNLLATPPGADQCDIYLLDFENKQFFERKEDHLLRHYSDGSRENMKSGIVEIPWVAQQQLYLGIRNPSGSFGIHVTVEVVAIVHEQEYAEQTVTLPQVKTYKTPYLKN